MFDASNTDYLVVTDCLKATPVTEGGERFIYVEASNESLDQQNEIVLAKALADSVDYFLKFGNLDIDHVSQIGAMRGIPDYTLYEIGRPVDARIDDRGKATFVKGQIYAGEGNVAEKANQFWDSLTKLNPPARWYPSVGGSVLSKAVEIDAKTKTKRTVVEKVRWCNLGFSKTPVNPAVPTVSTVPIGNLAKALTAGYGTDSAALSGGSAMRIQSLSGIPHSYWDARDAMSEQLRKLSGSPKDRVRRLVGWMTQRWGLSADEAAGWVERLLTDLENGRRKKS